MNARPSAVLLDRDGTINVKAPDGDYITHPDQVQLIPGAAQAIAALNRASIPVVVVTNQRGIALGRMTEEDLEAVGATLDQRLEVENARLDWVFHCPHDKGTCSCRKPGTLLLERARQWLGLPTLAEAVMIGDSESDVLAGRAVGARTVLLATDRGEGPGSVVAGSLLEAVQDLLAGALAVATE